MAEYSDRKAALIAELDQARSRAVAHRRAMRREPGIGARTNSEIRKNRYAWLLGALVLGMILAKLPPRKKKTRGALGTFAPAPSNQGLRQSVMAGALLGALKLAFELAKPLATTWATTKLKESIRPGSTPPRRPSPVQPRF